jgi:RNA 2',3'-cyclic 3'-phosphodiesterase
VRLFFALWPPDKTVSALAAWAAQAQLLTGGKLTRPESIHLTLAFLGEVAEERVEDAIRAARSVRGARHSLPIERAKVWRHNRIAGVGPEKTPAELESLHEVLREQLLSEGFQLEARPFSAHVTLIRNTRKAALPPLSALDWPVEEFTLVRSRLSQKGSGYEVTARFTLDR